ncbi:MAG: hypothetical protein KJO18_08525 [Acidimicrobiia bacterium]|nr:hypothetical protein [Acidimicrobiia bacterium]
MSVHARIVRDGQIYPVDPPPGAPSPLRMVANAAALFVLMLGVGLAAMAVVPVALGYRLVVVSSSSMEPSLSVADVVIAADPGEETVVVGAVIDIETETGGLIHRVVEVVPGGFRTKGDANATADSGIVAPESVNGIGVFLVPFIGLPRIWFDNGEWLRLGALVTLFVVVGYTSRSDWLKRGRRPKSSERSTHAADGAT